MDLRDGQCRRRAMEQKAPSDRISAYTSILKASNNFAYADERNTEARDLFPITQQSEPSALLSILSCFLLTLGAGCGAFPTRCVRDSLSLTFR